MYDTLRLGETTEKQSGNALFLGTAGSGKWNFFAENIKNQEHANMVVVDVDNTFYEKTKKSLKKKGYHIQRVCALEGTYNPFDYMNSDENIISFADIIARQLVENRDADPFWYAITKNAITDLLKEFRQNHDLSELNMKQFYDMCATPEKYSKNVSDKTASSIAISLAAALESYQIIDDKKYEKVDLSLLFTGKRQAVFLELDVSSDLPNMIYIILLSQLMNQVTADNNKLKNKILFFLNEATNLPVLDIPHFKRIMREGNDYGMQVVLEAQNVHNPFMDMVDYIVYSGGNTDAEAAEYLSQKMGEILSTTEPTDSTSGQASRRVFTDSEILRMMTNEELILIADEGCILDKKIVPLQNKKG